MRKLSQRMKTKTAEPTGRKNPVRVPWAGNCRLRKNKDYRLAEMMSMNERWRCMYKLGKWAPIQMQPASLVRQRVNRVLLRGFECRIDCAPDGAHDGDAGGTQDPSRGHQDAQGGKVGDDGAAGGVANHNAYRNPQDRQQDRLAKDGTDDVRLRGAHRLQDADFAGSLHHRRVHGLEDRKSTRLNS